ncbi:MAG: hypothetical protein WCD70_17320 [Alphaproteobacteria bacterium]
MLDFHQYVARHGESGVQAIIESLERFEGTLPGPAAPLEERWNALMYGHPLFDRCFPRRRHDLISETCLSESI